MTEQASLSTGFLLKDRYQIDSELGRGGIGIVYLARDRQLHDRPVVVKVLLENSWKDEWIRTKFRQEMEALSRLDHPGIVSLLDTGETSDGRLYLVMQYVQGVSLRSILTPQGMDVERAVGLLKQIGEALAAAHERGVLHRDLKPENVMIQSPGPGEKVKIIDFGLAKVFNSSVAESTAIPNVVGSYSYMAPEQLMARPVSKATDIYSLGVIAYEMLTGRRPHTPDSMFQLLEMLRAGVRVKPDDLRPSLPPAVSTVVLKALAYDSGDRPESADWLGKALDAALRDLGPTVVEPGMPRSVQTSRESPATSSPAPLPVMLCLTIAAAVFLKVWRFRFESWGSLPANPAFLSAALAWVLLLLAVPLAGWIGHRRLWILERVFTPARSHALIPAALLLSAALLGAAAVPPAVITGALAGGRLEAPACCTLNYSDPRGYLYTFQEKSYYSISINPGGWNTLSDYEVRITLPPQLEFADIYLDRGFGIQEMVQLEPSPSNDILILRKRGDTLDRARSILFTTKHRNEPGPGKIQVLLQSEGSSYAHEF